MTRRLEEVVAGVRELPEDEQERVAEALIAARLWLHGIIPTVP